MERLALFKKKTIQIRQQLQVTGHLPRNFSKNIGGWGVAIYLQKRLEPILRFQDMTRLDDADVGTNS